MHKPNADWDAQLRERPFRAPKFDTKLQAKVLAAANRPYRRRPRIAILMPIAIMLLVLGAVGGYYLAEYQDRMTHEPVTPPPSSQLPSPSASPETPPPSTDDAAPRVLVPAEERLLLAATEDSSYVLYADRAAERDGRYSHLYVENEAGEASIYPWQLYNYEPAFGPTMQLVDLTADGQPELFVILTKPKLNSKVVQEAYVIRTQDMTEIPVESASDYAAQNAESRVDMLNGYLYVELLADKRVFPAQFIWAFESTTVAEWHKQLDFTYDLRYQVVDNPLRIYATLTAAARNDDGAIGLGQYDLSYHFTEQGMVVDGTQFTRGPEQPMEIPLYAIRVQGKVVALRDQEKEIDLAGLLGEPLSEEKIPLGGDGFTGSFLRKASYDGLEMEMFSADGSMYWVMSMRLTNNRYMSSLGIAVGDSEEKLLEAYPSLERANDGREGPDEYAYDMDNGDLYDVLTFEVSHGVVKEISYKHWIN